MKERLLEVTVEIGGYLKAQEAEIERVCMVEWNFREDDFFYRPSDDRKHLLLEASALGTIYGDEGVDSLIQRIERAVWRANGRMCHVEVRVVGIHCHPKWSLPVEDDELQAA